MKKENYKNNETMKLLYEANNLGVWLWIEGGKLKFKSPKNADVGDLMSRLKAQKEDIIKVLTENNVTNAIPQPGFIYRQKDKQSVLSFAQERLWFIEQYEEGSNAYHIPVLFEVDQATDIEGLKYAIQQIVARHEVLRSTIGHADEGENGVQIVHEKPLKIEEVIVTNEQDLNGLIKADINRPFKLNEAYPIFVKFYSTTSATTDDSNATKQTLLLVNVHHIAGDGWSMDIFQKELLAYYEAYIGGDTDFELPPLEVQYKDFALWQRIYLSGKRQDEQLGFWTKRLSGYKPLHLPTDNPRPQVKDYLGASFNFSTPRGVSQKIRTLAQKNGVTVNSVLLSALNILLSKYTGQQEIVTGSPTANRDFRQLEGLIGFFVNTQANRTLLDLSQNFEDLIVQVHQEQIQAQRHQDLPFEKLVDELKVEKDPSKHPIFQITFSVQSFGSEDTTLSQQKKYLQAYSLDSGYEIERFDISLFIDDSQSVLKGRLSYATSLFEMKTISRFIHHFNYLLDQLTKLPARPYSSVNLLLDPELDALFYQKQPQNEDQQKNDTLVSLFEKQVEQNPDSVAVSGNGYQLTYQELHTQSDQLAHFLQQKYSVKSNDILGVRIKYESLLPMVVLATAKSGGAFVILNTDDSKIKEDSSDPISLVIDDDIIEEFKNASKDIELPFNPPLIQANTVATILNLSGDSNGSKEAKVSHKELIGILGLGDSQGNLSEKLDVSRSLSSGLTVFEIFGALLLGEGLSVTNLGSFEDFSNLKLIEEKELQNNKVLACSEHQKRIWFIDNFEKEYLYEKSPSYHNLPLILEIPANSNIDKVNYVWKELLLYCDFLRTNIHTIDGVPSQVINDLNFQEIEIQNMSDVLESEALKEYFLDRTKLTFDIEKDIMIRLEIIENSGQLYFLIVGHHILFDRKSLQLIATCLLENIEADEVDFKLLDGAPYSIYSTWQNRKLQNNFTPPSFYWKNKLTNTPVFYFETDNPRDTIHMYDGDMVKTKLDEELTDVINSFCTKNDIDPYMFFLVIYKILLFRLSENSELVIGTLYENREEPGRKNMIGQLSNLLSLKTSINYQDSFMDYMAKVAIELKESIDHSDYPFEKAVIDVNPEKDMSRTALFDLLFQYEDNKLLPQEQFNNIELNYGLGKYDLNLLVKNERTFELFLTYNKRFFYKERMERFLTHYAELVRSVVSQPKASIKDLEFIGAAEQEELIEAYNASDVGFPEDITVIDLFEEQVEKHPNRIALVFEDEELTYQELNSKSNQLAAYLSKHYSVKAEDLIGLKLERSSQMVIAILGILKSGGAYVPIDPGYPEERISFIISDTQCKLVIDQLEYDKFEKLADTFSTKNLSFRNKPSDIAYVIYTSGTTGLPKGVIIEHRSVIRLFITDNPLFDFNSEDVWTMFHFFGFDFSVWEMYGALFFGGKLIVVPEPAVRDPDKFLDLMVKHQVTVLSQTPSSFYNIINRELERSAKELALRYIILGGEPLSPSRLKEWKERYVDTKLINMYGITETTVNNMYKDIGEVEIEGNIGNIGYPIPTLSCYILDKNKSLLPKGASGEMYVGGAGVARGYLNRDELTNDRFILNPYKKGERIYKSGDKVKRLENGELVYISRLDDQVKIRGFRIELGEIAHILSEIDGVKQCCVIAKERNLGQDLTKYLAAYYVLEENEIVLSQATISEKLSEVLPKYMLPDAFVEMKFFPLTNNGKLDKRALPDPDLSASKEQYVPPVTEPEKIICEIWQDVLDLERVGLADDFFRIGGNSILAIQVSHRMSKALKCDVKVADLFRFKNINSMIENIEINTVEEKKTKYVF